MTLDRIVGTGGQSGSPRTAQARSGVRSVSLLHVSLATLALVTPGAAQAQVTERESITFSLNSRYDSNLPRLNDQQPNPRGFEREDIRVSPAVSLDLLRAIGRHQIGLRATLGYDFFVRNSQLDKDRISVEPSAYLDLPVCDLALDATASQQQSDLGELIIVGVVDPTLATDNQQTVRRARALATCGESYGMRPLFEYEYISADNSNPLRRMADYRSSRIRTGIGYATPSIGEISVFATRTATDLPNQPYPDGSEGGYVVSGLGLGYSRNIGTRLKFDGQVSSVRVRPNGPGLPARSGINGNASLTLVASPRMQIVGFASRAFTSTLTSNSAYELAESYGLTANYAATDRLRLRVGGVVSPRQFVYDATAPVMFIDRQTQYSVFLGASYDLTNRLRMSLDGGAERRDANPDFYNYSSGYASLGLSYRF